VAKASEVISICLENRLPIADNVQSPAKFAVPVSLTNIYKQGIFVRKIGLGIIQFDNSLFFLAECQVSQFKQTCILFRDILSVALLG
jgi:hypothetical protein